MIGENWIEVVSYEIGIQLMITRYYLQSCAPTTSEPPSGLTQCGHGIYHIYITMVMSAFMWEFTL